MEANHWKTQLILAPGDTLSHAGFHPSGFMAEEDINTYFVIDSNGEKKGEVIVKDHMAVRGSRRTIQFTQRDTGGKTLKQDTYMVSRVS